jgi:hypothetical protein
MKSVISKMLYIALIAGAASINLFGQSSATTYMPADKLLYKTIAVQDSILFEAFNSRNLERLKTFFADNLEVYQDNIGVRSYEQSMEAFRGLFTQDYVLTRTLVKESLEVYPIKDYGAIETGSHTFCHAENGKSECGTFKFVHIWEHKNGQWKITKIITYDHKL